MNPALKYAHYISVWSRWIRPKPPYRKVFSINLKGICNHGLYILYDYCCLQVVMWEYVAVSAIKIDISSRLRLVVTQLLFSKVRKWDKNHYIDYITMTTLNKVRFMLLWIFTNWISQQVTKKTLALIFFPILDGKIK